MNKLIFVNDIRLSSIFDDVNTEYNNYYNCM